MYAREGTQECPSNEQVKMSGIDREVARLETACRCLTDTVDQLEQRLFTVLLPECPQTAGTDWFPR